MYKVFNFYLMYMQAIDELKEDLFRAGVEYTEETLVVVGEEVEGLSKDTFVSV